MKSFFVVFACLFCLAASLDHTSYFPGRSAQIVISPNDIQDGSFLLLLNNERIIKHSQANEIDEISVADLIGHLLGTPILNDEASRTSFPISSVFNKPTANLLFVIDGIESDYGQQLLQVQGQKLKINKIAYPEDTIASLTTIASGQTPSAHGIVGGSWRHKGRTLYAYSTVQSRIANFIDVLSQSFVGESLTLSVSGDFQSSAAFAIHKDIQEEMDSWNNNAFYWNADSNRFDSIFGSSLGASLQLSRAAIVSLASQRNNVQLFDLKSQEDFLFFAELEMIQSVVATLSSDAKLSALVADSTPDAFTFVFSSLKGLVAKYGPTSPQATTAAALLNELISEIVENANTLYNGKLATEILVLAPSAYDSMKADPVRQIVFSAVQSQVVSKEVFDAFFPSIYVKEGVDADRLCDTVSSKLPAGYSAQCNTGSEYATFGLLKDSNGTNDTNTTNNSTSNSDAAEYQIVLWMSVLLILVLAAIIYGMCTLSEGDDSLLYRTTKKVA